jgi:flagellar protein FliJ
MREDNMLRSKRFEATEKARNVAMLESTISDFYTMVDYLARQIAAEEDRTKIRDTRHFAYSTIAKAATLRRRNLLVSVANLKPKLDAAKGELDKLTIQLRDLELSHSDTASPIDVAA